MKISSVIADIIQIINRKHSDLQNLSADDHTQYLDVAGTRPPKNIKSGLDASKPATPSVGDIYLATDTNKLYTCKAAGVWSRADWIVIPSGSAQGDILYYDGSQWNRLAAGTAGQFLKTNGAEANPSWATGTSIAFGFVASDTLRWNNDTERSTTSTSYVKLKEIKLNQDLPACRIKFDLKCSSNSSTAYAIIYKNGVAIGTECSNATTNYVNFSQDFTGFVSGDLIQIYAKNTQYTTYVKNFALFFDYSVQTFNGISLVNYLPTVWNWTTQPTNNS
jgi:hypothetical protein